MQDLVEVDVGASEIIWTWYAWPKYRNAQNCIVLNVQSSILPLLTEEKMY